MVYIIAQIGINHNGDLKKAKRLIRVAKDCGADAVKFNTYYTHLLVSTDIPFTPYQKVDNLLKSQNEMLKKNKLTENDFYILKKYSESIQIDFISTPFDHLSVELLERIGIDQYQIGSDDITNYPLLRQVALTGKPMILSTGMYRLDEVSEAVRFIRNIRPHQLLTLLYCMSSCPTPPEHVNLSAIEKIRRVIKCPVGFSDHTQGSEAHASMLAVALGASLIEKHITLDNNLPGPDHRTSLNPDDFKIFAENIRLAEKILWDDPKCIPCEEEKKLARRSLAVKHDLPKGHTLTYDEIIALRPVIDGVLKAEWLNYVVGQELQTDVKALQVLKVSDVYDHPVILL